MVIRFWILSPFLVTSQKKKYSRASPAIFVIGRPSGKKLGLVNSAKKKKKTIYRNTEVLVINIFVAGCCWLVPYNYSVRKFL
jgi:hypothetical protein